MSLPVFSAKKIVMSFRISGSFIIAKNNNNLSSLGLKLTFRSPLFFTVIKLYEYKVTEHLFGSLSYRISGVLYFKNAVVAKLLINVSVFASLFELKFSFDLLKSLLKK